MKIAKLLEEIKDDFNFIKSHILQPKWYKILKAFILLGVLAGYWYLFGFKKSAIFFTVFICLSLLLHLLYRSRTNKFKQSWLDFIVVEDEKGIRAKSIGIFYYSAIILNATISLIVSQVFP